MSNVIPFTGAFETRWQTLGSLEAVREAICQRPMTQYRFDVPGRPCTRSVQVFWHPEYPGCLLADICTMPEGNFRGTFKVDPQTLDLIWIRAGCLVHYKEYDRLQE